MNSLDLKRFHWLLAINLFLLSKLITSWVFAQPGVRDYAYVRGIVYESNGDLCKHVPPEASFIVLLNNDDSKILTESAPRWAPNAEPNITGTGSFGVELGNFINPEVAVSDSFALVFSCLATGEQGTYRGQVTSLPWSDIFLLSLSSDNYVPPPESLRVEIISGVPVLTWKVEAGLTYSVYRRSLTDTLSDGHSRFQYTKLIEGVPGPTFQDNSADSSGVYAYLLIARDSLGNRSPHSPEVMSIPKISGLRAIPRNTTVELHWDEFTSPGIRVVGYNIYRRQEGEEYPSQPVAYVDLTPGFNDCRLQPNTTYYYQVRSRDLDGNEMASSDEVSVTTDNTPAIYTRWASLRVAVIIYTNTSGGRIATGDIPKIKRMLEEARLFYWRNSGLKMNLDFSYFIIDEYKDINPEDYSTGLVESDLRNQGVMDLQFDAVFRISPATNGYWSWGVVSWSFLGPPNSTAFSHSHWPVVTGVIYPAKEPGINFNLTWTFTHEFQHAMDGIYAHNGHEEMAHGDAPLDFAAACGEHFDFQAKIYRAFDAWLSLSGHWGQILESEDLDHDSIPDNDPRVPLDEARFGSDPQKIDTDQDGYSDWQEATAGIYKASTPNLRNTDGDGIVDGEDKYPIYAVHSDIPQFTPNIDGQIEDRWHLLIDKFDFETTEFPIKVYLNWNKNFLFLAFDLSGVAIPSIFIDAHADGWWHSKDNYELQVDPYSGTFLKAHVMDCTPEARAYSESIGRGYSEMWDDDPAYVSHFGRIIYPNSFSLASRSVGNGYQMEIAIPRNEMADLTLQEGDSLGLRLYFQKLNNNWKDWGTIFEQYSFVNVKLVKTTEVAFRHGTGSIGQEFRLLQNYPNPFNSRTIISYTLKDRNFTQLKIFNLLGQVVRTLVHQVQDGGFYRIAWDGKDDFGRQVSSGIYILKIHSGSFIETKKLVVLR